ncbi:adenylate/guanylate cyclase domain-containing protein [Bradyrhizobium sp. JYMT SZCCT0180]|uniref:adenylate/guanylate cyclase domain-containing protein n=1 Tax=Bradyrhizobium sp. JYMT SZCCT0180 TaxID=2807666 RepID=UPI001BA8DAA1|nr:adenylate/guanylate cyclase domain-containing protein [Bradyrhizobium sp. JYMT SZCCT0180]MBR1211990.1 AAA family ATPase [Bradyrhizobium sp. JYMT SZCCT0180]
MREVADWLKGLGLERYTRCFAENDIDLSILGDLNDSDLEKIGVASLGHRRKLLRAIADLANLEKHPSAAASLPAGTAVGGRQPDLAERRQVTVMFSDLVGSTALSARLDPEDLREVISAYQNCVAEIVRRFGGFVAKYMGDGVLIYFGYPQSHEDDAEQAVRAGLEVVAAVNALQASVPLQTRVGIATGLVVVGDLIGSGEAQERSIIGETPNFAARLQGVAEPNMVVIADNTRRLLGDLFELEDLGLQDLKGIVGPARAWAALRESAVESRFEAMHATGLTALVGRDEEGELLLRRWSRAGGGEGQVVLISGEAGIGKSRLTAALLERLAGEPHTRLRYFCSPQHTDNAFNPIIGQMERAAGFRHDDAPQVKCDKLDTLLAQASTSSHDIVLFANMLSLPNDGRYPALGLTPQQQRQRTLQALVSQLEALTRQSPVLMIFEDAHWTDPTSLEVLGLVVERIQALPVLLIVTFRPEFEPPWIGRPHVTSLTINRLAEREIVSLIDRIVGGRMLPAGIRRDIIERADGIPLFVEEMTKAVLEAESEGEARRTAAAVPSPTLAVPASLHASLMARLDRLGAAKEVAQKGAAIGREFSYALLTAVTGKPDAELGSALDRLIAAGLLFRQGVPPHATYLFKHALVQDAAYGTLLREPRRALHARIANALEGQFADVVATHPQLLAHHCTEAGLIEKAAGLWGEAGQRSLARSALVEGAAQLTRAINQITTLPTTPALRREQIKLQVALANAMMHTKGYAAPETKASLDRARLFIERAEALGESTDDPLLLFSVLYGFWVASFVNFNGDICCELARQFLALAEKQGATVPLMIGHRIMGNSLLLAGDVAEARVHYDRGAALYNPAEHRPLAMRFGQDIEVSILSFRALALWLLGYPEAALADTHRALKNARAIGQATTLMFALSHVPLTCIQCGDYAAAIAQADEVVKLADEKGTLLWKAAGTIFKGFVFALTGSAPNAIQMISCGIDATRWTGSTLWMPLNLSYLALGHAELGQFDDAWRCIGDAMSASETTKSKWCQAETYRVAGKIALMLPAPDAAKAEAHFERALGVAREQQAKSWELRAATNMARLWCDQGKPQQAHDLLAPIYGWFTEGFNTLDLKRAKALLVESGECVSAT